MVDGHVALMGSGELWVVVVVVFVFVGAELLCVAAFAKAERVVRSF